MGRPARVTIAPCFLSLSFGSLAFIRGRDVGDAIATSVWPAWKVGTAFWPAVSLATYRFVPVQWRPAVGSCVGAVWSTYLSFAATSGGFEDAPPLVVGGNAACADPDKLHKVV